MCYLNLLLSTTPQSCRGSLWGIFNTRLKYQPYLSDWCLITISLLQITLDYQVIHHSHMPNYFEYQPLIWLLISFFVGGRLLFKSIFVFICVDHLWFWSHLPYLWQPSLILTNFALIFVATIFDFDHICGTLFVAAIFSFETFCLNFVAAIFEFYSLLIY